MAAKVFSCCIFLLVSTAVHGQLEAYLWKNRLLILKHPDLSVATKTRNRFLRNPEKLVERDLLLFICSSGSCYDRQGNVVTMPACEFDQGLTLVGKDGSIKYRGTLGTPVSKIMDLIDSMPMRKAEMGRNEGY